jgi:hypothetical protein
MSVQISVADQQALATEVASRLQSLDSNVAVSDLVFLSRVIELFNGNANQSAVSQEGADQIAAVIAQSTTEQGNIAATATTQIGLVGDEGQTQRDSLDGLKDQIVSDLNQYGMSPLKVFFLSQS